MERERGKGGLRQSQKRVFVGNGREGSETRTCSRAIFRTSLLWSGMMESSRDRARLTTVWQMDEGECKVSGR